MADSVIQIVGGREIFGVVIQGFTCWGSTVGVKMSKDLGRGDSGVGCEVVLQ